MMMTSPLGMAIRRLTRRMGVNKVLSRLIAQGRYEDRFGPAVEAEIRLGDTVWDVGANIGLYTARYLDLVGASGRVVAFEPTTACFAKLQEKFSGVSNAALKNIALGASDGTVAMQMEVDPLAATHRIVSVPHGENRTVDVVIRSAASLVAERPELFPNVIKVDVEGHEGAVMDGMDQLLNDNRLRCIGLEVHFGLLDKRGEKTRPRWFEETLTRQGFSVHWTDPSHLLAIR